MKIYKLIGKYLTHFETLKIKLIYADSIKTGKHKKTDNLHDILYNSYSNEAGKATFNSGLDIDIGWQELLDFRNKLSHSSISIRDAVKKDITFLSSSPQESIKLDMMFPENSVCLIYIDKDKKEFTQIFASQINAYFQKLKRATIKTDKILDKIFTE